MYRWHKELPLLKSRLKVDFDEHHRSFIRRGGQIRDNVFTVLPGGKEVLFDGQCGCELGMFRKRRPTGCTRGRACMCKAYKHKGNSKDSRRFSEIRRMIIQEDEDGNGTEED